MKSPADNRADISSTSASVYQDLSTFKIDGRARGRSPVLVQIWWLTQSLFFHTSPQSTYGWRRWLLRLFGAKIGKNVILRPTVSVTYPWKLEIGDFSWIGDNVDLYNLDTIRIGRNAVVSQGCYLCTGSHDYTDTAFTLVTSPIIVEDEAWIASQSFVAPGVRIGRASIVGARSLVLSDTPPAMIVFGQPATVRGERRSKGAAIPPSVRERTQDRTSASPQEE